MPRLEGARILVTGHTGFTGSWLCQLLDERGAEVCGLSLPPAPGSLYDRASLGQRWSETFTDIRDFTATVGAIESHMPDAIIHLAAQPLVRFGYAEPLLTFSTNAAGTAHVLEAARRTESVQAVVVVTTDKVYAQPGSGHGFRESDPLGGEDPYSASKTAAEMAVNAWRAVIAHDGSGPTIVTVRAGNLVGGGDTSRDRLLPDLIGELARGGTPQIRNPNATRPWQHVLDAADGYARTAAALLAHDDVPPALNLGPRPEAVLTVADVADITARAWGGEASWHSSAELGPPETESLSLDANLALARLGWENHWTGQEAVLRTVDWWRAVLSGRSALSACQTDLSDYR